MTRLAQFLMASILFCYAPLMSANNQLPEIGTAGASALTIDKEIIYGNAYMRIIRASSRMTNDPVLSEYVTELGNQLVAKADAVRTPFNFFLVTDNEINAAAFLGGYVKIHTGLFLYAATESEFASVIAHEIAHVTQRHIARSIENQAAAQNLSMAGMLGSLLLGLANPVAGIAALQATMAAGVQNSINYTRANEFEADRIGLRTLAKAGYDPSGMGNFFGKLSEKYRYASKPPQMLITHPLPETRVSEARARANQYPNRYVAPSLSFQLAKSRIIVRHGTLSPADALEYYQRVIQRKEYRIEDAALYGKSLALFGMGKYQESKTVIDDLAKRHPDNLFIIDTQTDIDLALKQYDSAIKRLKVAQTRYPNNQVIVLNLAHAYSENGKFEDGAKTLDRYLREKPNDALGWGELSRTQRRLNNLAASHTAQAEYLSLHSDYRRAIDELHSAYNLTKNNLEQARIQARIEQFKLAEQELEALN
ncbi:MULTISPECIES: M48 family metalloprotease [unclassified Agarivorans]|uniref:beta-barrel assembly-enhancing protease n=1 Tax=unclassified Agarivorans TaxID=2636026 RepID=UPI0010F91B92|nr:MULTISPECIES: M48 family metalloprotease [unclassified Agarivorans]MDO6766006.1 M48 family metalloprotease [Agarivorans sp. 1_MG-2023]